MPDRQPESETAPVAPVAPGTPGRTVPLAPLATGLIRLDELLPRQCAMIARVDAEADELDRLKAMGVCVGRKVELVKRGDPLILRVLGSRLGVSARLARRVEVHACDQPQCHPADADSRSPRA